jgi:hypothetical protein
MKKSILILLIFITFTLSVGAQNCPENITFTTQAEIDAFPINYPGCTSINGYVLIHGSNITNLNGLSLIETIGGGLSIHENQSLNNMDGLNALQVIGGGLSILYNESLIDMNDLNELESILGFLDINFNPSRENLEGTLNM